MKRRLAKGCRKQGGRAGLYVFSWCRLTFRLHILTTSYAFYSDPITEDINSARIFYSQYLLITWPSSSSKHCTSHYKHRLLLSCLSNHIAKNLLYPSRPASNSRDTRGRLGNNNLTAALAFNLRDDFIGDIIGSQKLDSSAL